MTSPAVIVHISDWLKNYALSAKSSGFVVGISGGIDSAVTSTLCAKTGLEVLCIEMNIHQHPEEVKRGLEHIQWLEKNFVNVRHHSIDLTKTFETLKETLPANTASHDLAMANTRSRLRMVTLYAVAQTNNLLVAGTGNKVEDFGVGFFTKYGDGGVDLSPIADLTKTEVYALAKEMDIVPSIQSAAPTDGLWKDVRTDEGQLGASYPELEWAMEFSGDEKTLNKRQKEVLEIFRNFNRANRHKMQAIPVCLIPVKLKE